MLSSLFSRLLNLCLWLLNPKEASLNDNNDATAPPTIPCPCDEILLEASPDNNNDTTHLQTIPWPCDEILFEGSTKSNRSSNNKKDDDTTPLPKIPCPCDEILPEASPNNNDTTHLPTIPCPCDEILLEIFSRLAAKYVLRCRTVCRNWKAITSTQYFAELHYRNHVYRASGARDLTVLVEKYAKIADENFVIRNNRTIFRELNKLKKKLYSFDGWRETSRIRTKTGTHRLIPESEYRHVDEEDHDEEEDESTRRYHMSFSACGFVGFQRHEIRDGTFTSHSIILNPITREKIKITLPPNKTSLGQVYGLFFHPVLKEFCVLWGQVQTGFGRLREVLEFKLLNLGPSQSCWRNIIKPSHLNKYQPRLFESSFRIEPPVVVDNVLYWMADYMDAYYYCYQKDNRPVNWAEFCRGAILAFDINREEFNLLPHPSPECKPDISAGRRHGWMQLLEMNRTNGRVLALSENLCRDGLFNLWMFSGKQRDDKELWVKKYTVEVQFPSDDLSPSYYLDGLLPIAGVRQEWLAFFPDGLRPLAVVDDELLLLYWREKGLIVQNLKMGTSQIFFTVKGKSDPDGVSMFSHIHSFFPMRNSNPEILVE